MPCYRAFELIFHSELALPEMAEVAQQPQDVSIRFGEVSPTGLREPKVRGLAYQSADQELWLDVPGIARFLVKNGNEIVIDAKAGADPEGIRYLVLSSCCGALLQQRGLFVLHGSVIQVGNHAVSFIGLSGAGKSTLAAAFLRRGNAVLSDDICAIDREGRALSSFPQLNLWRDSVRQLEWNPDSLSEIRKGLNRYAVPLKRGFHSEGLPLRFVYLLQSTNKPDFEITPLKGMQKHDPLKNHKYRADFQLSSAGGFLRGSQVANQITLIRLARPKMGFRLKELVEWVEKDLGARDV